MSDIRDSLLLRALRREPVPRPPVWIMRQAGRYMPEFRAVRAKHSFLTVCKTPELACEVTLQPIGPIGVDAAIIFSDILTPLEAMGMALVFDEKGPHLPDPIRSPNDIQKLRTVVPEEGVGYLGQALRMVKAALPAGMPLLGFAGAPWTLAAYMIEGGGSKNYDRIKRFMYNEPEAFDGLMNRLVAMLVDYLRYQIGAGADAVQIFESWGGVLSPRDFERFALPYTRRVVAGVKGAGVPVIVYMNGAGQALEHLAGSGCDAVGIDWRTDLGQAFDRIGGQVAIQGNMDPCMLYAPVADIAAEVRRLHAQVAGRPGHVFNLGHGILPDVPVPHAQAFVDAVKSLAEVATRA
ncbi:MAG: uroporphyrinogen decarboxylase [Candidatus Sericytochromatia bacterium]|nr:uroporphyrinogen decarboxylase [Candidatus Sericytochromatia bacterium]